jgi:NAD(P)-dependent dehydrogenase (short-subunit alcohol dehydrogenase family)
MSEANERTLGLPQMRKQGRGLLVWVSSGSVAGETPPYLSPYFAARVGMDALAVLYTRELALWGIETSIIVPGAFTRGTNHFAHAGGAIVPDDADVGAVAEAIAKLSMRRSASDRFECISIQHRTEPRWCSG